MQTPLLQLVFVPPVQLELSEELSEELSSLEAPISVLDSLSDSDSSEPPLSASVASLSGFEAISFLSSKGLSTFEPSSLSSV